MNLYAFVSTIPGTASFVAAELVRIGAERAVEVTGLYDVAARFVDQTWESWAGIKNGASQIAGVTSIREGIVVDPGAVGVVSGRMPFSDPRWGPSGLVLLHVAPADGEAVWERLRAAKRGGAVKAMVGLLGAHDIMIQVAGKDESAIAATTMEVLRDIPEIRDATTCLILRGVPAANYPAPKASRAPRRTTRSAKAKR
ncbi:MAG TPA: hypothetical protein VM841_07955 [Actinomycetota bacterium]|nr:hypothetical protein [Actinomycetota bacterium]